MPTDLTPPPSICFLCGGSSSTELPTAALLDELYLHMHAIATLALILLSLLSLCLAPSCLVRYIWQEWTRLSIQAFKFLAHVD